MNNATIYLETVPEASEKYCRQSGGPSEEIISRFVEANRYSVERHTGIDIATTVLRRLYIPVSGGRHRGRAKSERRRHAAVSTGINDH